MKLVPLSFVLLFISIDLIRTDALGKGQRELHFGFETDNGYQRSENIIYNETATEQQTAKESNNEGTPRPVEYRGGYSFISSDGYEYQVRYKANSKGFQPYVTAHKLKPAKDSA